MTEVRNDTPRPRIAVIPYMTDLVRGPRRWMVPPDRRAIAHCCTCQCTVYGAEYQECARLGHEIRYLLVSTKPG